MPINSTEVSYGLGQLGSAFTDSTSTALLAPAGKAFVAIQFLKDTKFDTTGGLVAIQDTDNAIEYITTAGGTYDNDPAHDTTGTKGNLGVGGQIVDSDNIFPRGLTIYGRWTSIGLAQGSIIAYIGD
tara:strand:+ start:952 stop:1332 length:381 start_codon:yes stop_codon:yes gene_type:complete